jgi:hypothetical protein
MKRGIVGAGMLIASSAAVAAPQSTDFGIRAAPGAEPAPSVAAAGPAVLTQVASAGSSMSLAAAVAVVSRYGRVTSTRRSRARNRAVGGAPNSYHLSGRAIDVVPRGGVRHADIEAALRRAGFSLAESLDEGDHSHFALGRASNRVATRAPVDQRREVTEWRVVSAPRMASR